jgi:hypothetical protein
MTNPLKLIQDLDTPRERSATRLTKSRRLRRQEERDRIRSAKVHQKSA